MHKEETFTKRTRIEEIALLIEKNGKMSLDELAANGIVPHSDSIEALRWYGKDK